MSGSRFSLVFSIAAFCAIGSSAPAQETLRVVTWNIEHLGSPGRGLGGIGAGSLNLRSDSQLRGIARFIRDDLHADLVAMQEVAISDTSEFGNVSNPLETILDGLGDAWTYHIGNPGGELQLGSIHNMQNAFLWNTAKVRAIRILDLPFPNEMVGSKRLFDRLPAVGHFQAVSADHVDANDFLLVNVHLTSGQENDENHLAAMVIIEQNLNSLLRQHNFRESDRIILGDFNDNPFARDDDGDLRFIDLLYRYMELRGFQDLVTEDIGFTRLNDDRSSIIDHVLVNRGIRSRHLASPTIERFLPTDTSEAALAAWRRDFSDHLPLTVVLRVDDDDDVD